MLSLLPVAEARSPVVVTVLAVLSLLPVPPLLLLVVVVPLPTILHRVMSGVSRLLT